MCITRKPWGAIQKIVAGAFFWEGAAFSGSAALRIDEAVAEKGPVSSHERILGREIKSVSAEMFKRGTGSESVGAYRSLKQYGKMKRERCENENA